MNSKAYLAIYDEQRLFSDFIHNNLERFHQYDVLFSAPSEELLLASLTSEVKLLLIHIPIASDRLVELVKKVLRKFGDHKLLIYTPESEIMQTVLDHHSKKVKIVSSVFGSRDFFEALQEMMPDHQNHKISNTTKIYNQSGFEKIRNNRKWILILKSYEVGRKPKEMEGEIRLKSNTINSYTEQMLKETNCGNIIELILEAKRKSIL